jgi:2-polyprenyl-3-methyl-5-hydroxy-6-metoxy-1,4-benzoquinol methylase
MTCHPFLVKYPFREVVAAYDSGVVRLYCRIRAHILREKLLREIGQFLPKQGLVTEIGCGFGLFANCFAQTHPQCQFSCCDLNRGRILSASQVADRLGIDNIRFIHENALEYFHDQPPQDCIYMLDLVHHLPKGTWEGFLEEVWANLKPGGTLILKDVSTRPWPKMAFTWMLDILMTRFELPNYLSPEQFIHKLETLSGDLTVHTLDDYLPYPHMLYVARKPAASL